MKAAVVGALLTSTALAGPALAQEVDELAGIDDPASLSTVLPEEPEPEPEPIVVTGTRLPDAGGGPPTPVVAQTAETLLRSQPLGLAEALLQLPQFFGSLSARNRQAISTDGRGNYLNPRNVGTIRTLIMLDGERLPPTTVGGLVDVDNIPEMLIKRVEVATSGVSAVYGLDAVPAWSTTCSTRGSRGLRAMRRSAWPAGAMRSTANSGWRAGPTSSMAARTLSSASNNPALQSGTAANPYVFASDVRNSLSTPGGRIITGPAAIAGAHFEAAGRVAAYDPGQFIGVTTQIGGSGQPFDPAGR